MDENTLPHLAPQDDARHGRLSARPTDPKEPVGAAGLHRLDTGLLYVPPQPAEALRLLVVLHGAGGSARQALDLLADHADDAGLILLAPQSQARTWDVIVGNYGADVRRIDATLAGVFAAYRVDPEQVAVGGFSDGASYALSLGVANGDLFRAVVAFSPGFLAPLVSHGRPRIFVSHGVHDHVLPVDRCSRRLVPSLQSAGYDVTYREFDGGHDVPSDVTRAAVGWLSAGSAAVARGEPGGRRDPGR